MKLTKSQLKEIIREELLKETNKSLPPFEIAKRMMKSKYWNKAGKGFSEKVIKKFRGRGVTPKSLDKWLPDYIDGKEISKLFEGKLNEVRNTRFQQWSDHVRNLDKLLISTLHAKKAIPHKKKELVKIEKLYRELKNLVEIIVGQSVDM